jgi:AcrR family transcriptional regulator
MTSKDILTVEERRKKHHAQMVSDILLIARDMMQTDGVAALSFNAIARRLGMKPPSLYTYFDSKHAIYDALFRMGFEAFHRKMTEETRRGQGIQTFLSSLISTYMAFALENYDLFQLMFQRPVPGFVPSEESLEISFSILQKGRDETSAELRLHNIETPTPINETTDLIISMMHGLTEMQLANSPDAPVGEGRFGGLIHHSVHLFLDAWNIETDNEGLPG